MATQADDEVWHVFYSERAQREYYYHPKTKVVTWIIPDELHPDGSAFEPPVQMDDANHHHRDDEIPRGLVLVESHQKKLNQTRRVLSGRALTYVLLALSTVITSVFWGLQQGSDHHFSHDLLGVANKRMICSEQANRTSRIIELGHNDEEEDKQATETSSNGKPPDVQQMLSDADFKYVLPSAALVLDVAPSTPVVVKWHKRNIERGGPRSDLSMDETNFTQQSKEKVVNSVGNESRNVQTQQGHPLDKTATSTSPSHTLTIDVAGSHLNRRGCFIPLAHLLSRKCRQAVKSRPLFDAQALVDSMML